jgi:hypothetical protein
MSMRSNIKLFPDAEAASSRADRFESEMTIHATLDEAKASIKAALDRRDQNRIERRQRILKEG